jgi:predicted PurR-regulated permease PerM
MNPVAISIITIVVSTIMTIIVGIISYFLKRYIDQSDEINRDLYNQIKISNEKLIESVTQLRVTITKIQAEAAGERERYNYKHAMIAKDIDRVKNSIGALWREVNKKKDK